MTTRLTMLLIACSAAAALSGCTRLVFVRGHEGAPVAQVYTMRSDGSEQGNLSQSEFASSYPDPSADGGRIAFSSTQTAGGAIGNIYLMPTAGGARSQLTAGAFQKWAPRWGPRGLEDRIVYSELGPTGLHRLYIVRATGAAQVLTNPGPDFSDKYADIYYSVGTGTYKVIFSRLNLTTQRSRLVTINIDGTGESGTITKDIHDNEDMPVVSNDGRRVAYRAYAAQADPYFEAVRVMSIDDWQPVSEVRLPVPQLVNVRGIGWSRSDRKLYVSMETSEVTGVTFTEERAEVFSMKPDGAERRRLTNNTIPDYWPNGIPCEPRWRFICALVDSFTGE